MKLIAHRGNNNHKYIENTKEALLESLSKNYIAGVECDVRLTKDNVLVLNHDMTINRTTSGSGFVRNKSYKQLKKYKITTLNNFLKNVNSDKLILIEIKSEDLEIDAFINKLINICKKYRLNYCFCSFRIDILEYLKEKEPTFKVGLLTRGILKNNINIKLDFVSIWKNNYSGKEKFVWTINNLKDLKKFYNKDVYILTDKAYLLKDYGK